MEIIYNKLLDNIFLSHVNADDRYKDIKIQSPEYLQKKIKDYTKWLAESKIDKKIEKVTGYKFKPNIKIYMVARSIKDLSDPLIIKSRYNKKKFLESLCHELCHRILVDNKHKIGSDTSLHKDKVVLNHIEVYRIMIKVLGEIEKPTDPRYYKAFEIASKSLN